MAFANNGRFEKFGNKVWLSSPSMYPESMRYVMEAYETNWMSTVGANINMVEKNCGRNIWNSICCCIILWYSGTSFVYEIGR